MTLEFYKILHIAGLLLTVFGLFGLASVYWTDANPKPYLRKFWMMGHGLGLPLLLVSGFGMAARLDIMKDLPNWLYAKLFIWILLGGAITLVKRKPKQSGLWIATTFVLALMAASLAILKPF